VEKNDKGPNRGMDGDALMGVSPYPVDEKLVYSGF
jgi:hypothetical protein